MWKQIIPVDRQGWERAITVQMNGAKPHSRLPQRWIFWPSWEKAMHASFFGCAATTILRPQCS